MKKVMVAAVAAMVLVSGASANDVVTAASDFFKTAEVTVGAGWSHTDDKEDAGVSLSLLSNPQQNIYALVSADVSSHYFSVSDVGVINIDKIPDPYVGFGYLKAEGVVTTAGECAPGMMFEGSCLSEGTIEATNENVKETGVFGTVGFMDRLDFSNGMTLSGHVGYRFGGISGPVAGVGVSSMFGDGTYGREIGFKLNVERIENDKEDIDRIALYATYTF